MGDWRWWNEVVRGRLVASLKFECGMRLPKCCVGAESGIRGVGNVLRWWKMA